VGGEIIFPFLPISIPFSPFRYFIISVALSPSLYMCMCLIYFRSDIYSYFLCSICFTCPVMLHWAVVYFFIVPTFSTSLTRHICGVNVNGVVLVIVFIGLFTYSTWLNFTVLCYIH
jgi:hypothetical protein